MSFSKFRNPLIRVSNCFWVSCSLAFESARACSNAVKRDSSELGACCCEGSIAGEGLSTTGNVDDQLCVCGTSRAETETELDL